MPKVTQMQPLQVYQLLPRTNCKRCGCISCYAFAFSLLSREKKPADCPELLKSEYSDFFGQLNQVFGKELTIAETGLAIDRERCTGCGDCVVICNKASRALVKNAVVVVNNAATPYSSGVRYFVNTGTTRNATAWLARVPPM